MSVETYTGTLTVLSCYKCGIGFGTPKGWCQERRDDHAWFWCPNGHQQHFPQESEEEKLRARLAEAERQQGIERSGREGANRRADAEARSAAAHKGHATRLRNKILRGECPFCNTKFPDVRAHMAEAHPDESPEA